MPCKLCGENKNGIMPCEFDDEHALIKNMVDTSDKDLERKSNSQRVFINMMKNCPCKECIVNSICNNGIDCTKFVDIIFTDVDPDVKKQLLSYKKAVDYAKY